MKKACFAFFVLLAMWLPACLAVDEPADLTTEQKIWGVMQVWSTAKYNFAYFDRVPNLDWDAEARRALPEVMNARGIQGYYRILQRLAARLNDGHTYVMPPDAVSGTGDIPPLEFQFVQGKIVLARVGMNAETRAAKLVPGFELVEVEGLPAHEYYAANFEGLLGGTEQWRRALCMSVWLAGEKNSRVRLLFRDLRGNLTAATLTRNAKECQGGPFIQRIFDFSPLLEKRVKGKGIVYFKLSTFFPEEIVAAFNREMDLLDLDGLKGMILDLRFNMGGNNQNAFQIVSRLISGKARKSRWKSRKYIPFFRAWGQAEDWHEGKPGEIEPSPLKNYAGPLAVLIGPHTCSAAEDFLVPLVDAKRAILVGETTAGSTGQPLQVELPAGGFLAVCTVKNAFPDGKEFVGSGIRPDIAVSPTQIDIFRKRDPALEKAIAAIRHCQSPKRISRDQQ